MLLSITSRIRLLLVEIDLRIYQANIDLLFDTIISSVIDNTNN